MNFHNGSPLQSAQCREEFAEQAQPLQSAMELHRMADETDELGPPKADFSAPPPYELTNSLQTDTQSQTMPSQQQQQQQEQQQQHQQQRQHNVTSHQLLDQNMLPVNMHHGKLPTYEEVQLEKSLNGELPPSFISAHGMQSHAQQPPPPPNPLLANIVRDGGHNSPSLSPALTFIAIDPSESDNMASNDNSLLGTDIMFILAFMVAFLFNWIGFLILTCFCHTIAGRYGALSGFGLSLAKWTLIVKHSTDLASHENSWLWWLIMAFGFLVCIRSLIQYVSIKRTWRLLSTSAQERLLFFY